MFHLGCVLWRSHLGASKGRWPCSLEEPRELRLLFGALTGGRRQQTVGSGSLGLRKTSFPCLVFGKEKGWSWIRFCNHIKDMDCSGTGWSPFIPSSNFQSLSAMSTQSLLFVFHVFFFLSLPLSGQTQALIWP